MVDHISFKGSFLTDMFKKNKPYREKINKATVLANGVEYSRPVNLVKEYENPNAKQILKQMRELPFPTTKNRDEFMRLNKELGSYKVIDLDLEKKTKKLYKQLDRDIMLITISEKINNFFNSIKKIIR